MNQYASEMDFAFGDSGETGAKPPFPARAGAASTSARTAATAKAARGFGRTIADSMKGDACAATGAEGGACYARGRDVPCRAARSRCGPDRGLRERRQAGSRKRLPL